MDPWMLLALGLVVSAVGLGWGLIMLLNPRKFAEITRVDWLPDVFDVRRKGIRLELRIVGFLMTAFALWFLIVLAYSSANLSKATMQ
jgi:hypothetical protein